MELQSLLCNLKKMDILGVRVDNLEKKEIMEKVSGFLDEPRFHQIATINPEFVLEAQKNQEFKNILNSTDLNIADGVGIRFAFWRFGKHLKVRIAGADLMMEILRLASEKNISIFLAAKKGGLSAWQETRDAVLKIYPNLNISGDNMDIKNTSYQIPNTRCQILFCNFGVPDQELFLNSQKNDRIRLAMGVGGSFDFLTGKVRRAPLFMRKIGLEWLWRLILHPWRWKRIYRAAIVFPIRVIFGK